MKKLVACLSACLASFGMLTATVHLTQSDFDSGTYRITVSDTYILDEDIVFEPIPAAEATRSDKPYMGWFAAITVETDNVTIDLNHHKIEASQFFVDNHIFKVFSQIELDNCPFSGVFFGALGTAFQGDTAFVSANTVVIKDGTLGRSSHWGIHGNNNSNIHIEKMRVKDFEVAGIELNGLVIADIHDNVITGNEHIIRVSPVGTCAQTLIKYLGVLVDEDFPGASDQFVSLVTFVNDNPQIFDVPSPIPQNTMYGIFLASGLSLATEFPVTPDDCALAATLSGGRTVENVVLHDNKIHSIHNAPSESVLIGSQTPGAFPFAFNLALLGVPVFGCGRWEDAFDADGNFAPNPFLQAQVFVVNSQIVLNPSATTSLPPNWAAISDSILNVNETEFLAETLPLFGLFIDGFPIKGTFGMRVDCAEHITTDNCHVCGIVNVGPLGTTLAEIPDGEFYTDLVESRYAGNDVWGFEFGNNEFTKITHSSAKNISTINGDAFGLDFTGFDSYVFVKHFESKRISGHNDNVDSVVNPPSVSYGYRVIDNAGPLKIIKSKAEKIRAPRFAFGFAVEESDLTKLYKCLVKNVKATSSKHSESPKQAFGIELEGATNTLIKCAFIKDIAITGEDHFTTSNSEAAGIFLDSTSADNTLICTSIHHIKGGQGTASKIDDQGTNTQIHNGSACHKICGQD